MNMVKYDVYNWKLEILMTLLFLQLLKLKKQKCAQNFYFPTKKWIFCNFNYCLKKFLGQYLNPIIPR